MGGDVRDAVVAKDVENDDDVDGPKYWNLCCFVSALTSKTFTGNFFCFPYFGIPRSKNSFLDEPIFFHS